MTAKRFIAGARCPACDQQDTLYVKEGSDSAWCASCGYEMLPPSAEAQTTL